MGRASVFQTYNNQTVFLEYNETLILLNSVCRVSIDFHADNKNEYSGHKGYYILNNWKFIFVFTDDVPLGKTALTSNVSFEENGKTIVITYYKWYGDGVENTEPLPIVSTDGKTTFLVKMKTQAYLSKPQRRTIHITIWKKMP